MELTVVLVQLAVRPTHRLVVGFAAVQAPALSQASLTADLAVSSQTTVLVLTRTGDAAMAHKPWKRNVRRFTSASLSKKGRQESQFERFF